MRDHSETPVRPAYGSGGDKIKLWANYFELLPDKAKPFYRYDVSMVSDKGEEPKGKKLDRCIRLLLQQLPSTIPIATDYGKSLITAARLPNDQQEYSIQYYTEGEAGPDQRSPRYRVKVQYTGSFTFSDLLDYLSSTDLYRDKPATREEIIQATNIIIASGMKSNTQLITKKNKYFPAGGNFVEKCPMLAGLEAFRGFFMSVRAATGRILLNVQVQHVVTWEALPMLNLLDKMKRDKLQISEANRMVAGITVEVAHLNNRIKRVAGFALQGDGRGTQYPSRMSRSYASATDVSFWRTQPAPARWITVADHFREVHRPLQQPGAFVLNVGTRRNPIYMPSELCRIKSLQTYDKKLSPKATDMIREFAVRYAPENARTIESNGIGLLQQNCNQILDAFKVNVNPSMITVSARVLQGITLQYSGGKTAQPKDGSWNMIETKFHLGATVPSWTYLWIKTGDNGGNFKTLNEVGDVVRDLHRTMEKCGLRAPPPVSSGALELTNAEDPDAEINKTFADISKKFRLVLVVLPTKSTTIYNAVKRAGDIRYGVHTIAVIAAKNKFSKKPSPYNPGQTMSNVQYHANVALKFNLKCGGRNQVLRDSGFIKEGKTMLVGLDVTHPAPGSAATAPSVSSITASIDSMLSQWPADIAIQTRRQEMVAGLKNMFKSRLTLWQKFNSRRLPEEIIVYRDGVGEGMYDLVRTQELSLIREACKEVYPATDTKSNKPYITIIICGKRHHTRFYPTNEKEADQRTGGTRNGTIVDRGVTEARVWDFYFQAHTALQGTPKSAHYVVIHDEVFRRRAMALLPNDKKAAGQRAADEVERLTNALSHIFGRATKAVSLCPPAYYADIACERARAWLSGVFDERSLASSQDEVRDEDVRIHPNLKDTMFYI